MLKTTESLLKKIIILIESLVLVTISTICYVIILEIFKDSSLPKKIINLIYAIHSNEDNWYKAISFFIASFSICSITLSFTNISKNSAEKRFLLFCAKNIFAITLLVMLLIITPQEKLKEFLSLNADLNIYDWSLKIAAYYILFTIPTILLLLTIFNLLSPDSRLSKYLFPECKAKHQDSFK